MVSNSKGVEMPDNENLPTNERSDSENTFWGGLFTSKSDRLLMGAGVIFLLVNVLVFFVDIRPAAWLFYLDMRYWPAYFSIAIWVTAMWIILESTGILEPYLPFLRILAATSVLFAVILAMQSSSMVVSPALREQPLWLSGIVLFIAYCTMRSLFLLYDYRYGEDDFDLEEAQWFWGMSGIVFAVFAASGLMYIVPVKAQYVTMETTVSLFEDCSDGFQELLRNGNSSFALRVFGLFIIGTALTFVYVMGRWLLIISLKIYLKVRGG